MSEKTLEERIKENVQDTYLSLRFGLFLLLALLATGILWQVVHDEGTLCGSISAYYYTAIRPVFVGSLCALGASLIMYRGNLDFENTALDVAGFSAFIVAFSPTPNIPSGTCTTLNVPRLDVGPLINEVHSIVDASVPSICVVGALAIALGATILRRKKDEIQRQPRTWLGQLQPLRGFSLAAYIVFVVLFILSRDGLFYEWGHGGAAVTLFVAMLFAIGANALDAYRKGKPRTGAYYAALDVTAILLIAIIALWPGEVPTRVFWVEAVGIGAFALFWLSQTIELRRLIVRPPAENPKREVPVMLH